MKGIILKDFLFIKSNLKSFFIFGVIFVFFSIFNQDLISICYFFPFFAILLCVSTFNYDEFNQWDFYLASLPLSRKQVVLSKYLFAVLILLITIFISCLFLFVYSLIIQSFEIESFLFLLFATIRSVLLTISLLYPMIYKFGSEKGRLFLFATLFGFGTLIVTVIKLFPFTISDSILSFFSTYGIYLLFLFILFFVIGSYLLSCRIYAKKEF